MLTTADYYIIVPLAVISSAVNGICLIYIILKILRRWWITKKSLTMAQRVPFYFALSEYFLFCIHLVNVLHGLHASIYHYTLQGISCRIIGGISFFFFSSNVILVGSLSLTTYLRICRRIVINLGTYDYKLFLVILLVSLTITLIGIDDYGHSKYWCYITPSNPITPIITISLIVIILLVTLYCYIMTIVEVYINVKKFGSKLSRVDIIVTRKIIFYILIFLFEWIPVLGFLISRIFYYEELWIHIVAALSVNIGGIGNVILYIIYENCNTTVIV
ncbi:hypothetical protein C2G38_2060952 [Gigaspora rosea]|uniref:G-protein coupled receptors family 1 profile domain-containing protein n=1 Tax=Gigaspora rosea TaxID=44941 RepID=A0A397VZ82_9GLOM|nr:hypothetical protein C2G38_2060952 [Gigaspora rosea]